VHLNTRVILTLLLPSSVLIHFHPHLSVPSSISLAPPSSGGWTRNCIILGIPLRSSLTEPFLCPSLTFGRRAHSTPSVSTLSHENLISISPTASYEMSQLNTKESTPAFVATGPVRSTTRRARAQTVPSTRGSLRTNKFGTRPTS
jgi:hypothetical protein